MIIAKATSGSHHDKKISLVRLFPNVKPFLSCCACQLPCMPLLAQKPQWDLLDISVNPMPFGNRLPLTERCVPASTADIVTTLHLQDIDTDRLDLSEFCFCSRLKTLTFRLWSSSEFFQTFQLSNLATLPKSCCTVKFLNFEPSGWVHLSELTGWHWEPRPILDRP